MIDFAEELYDFSDPVQAAVVAEAVALDISWRVLLNFYATPLSVREASATFAMQAAIDAAMTWRPGAVPPAPQSDDLWVALERLQRNASVPARELLDEWRKSREGGK